MPKEPKNNPKAAKAAAAPVQKHPSPAKNKSAEAFSPMEPVERPGFTSAAKQSAYRFHNAFNATDSHPAVDPHKPQLPSLNAAMPHRMSFDSIRENAMALGNKDAPADFERWTDRFLDAGDQRLDTIKAHEGTGGKLYQSAAASQDAFRETRDSFMTQPSQSTLKGFVRQANSFHANVPDIGPHLGVNNPVQHHPHLHVRDDNTLSPMSAAVAAMSPQRLPSLPTTPGGSVITTTGRTIPPLQLPPPVEALRQKVGTKVVKAFDSDEEW